MPPASIVPIIGGGPAAMSCALWLHNYGLHPIIIEREAALGGMARLSPYPDEWLLGQLDGSAREHAAKFAGHMRKLAIETWLDARPRCQRAGRSKHTVRAVTRTIADVAVQIRAAHSAHHQWF